MRPTTTTSAGFATGDRSGGSSTTASGAVSTGLGAGAFASGLGPQATSEQATKALTQERIRRRLAWGKLPSRWPSKFTSIPSARPVGRLSSGSTAAASTKSGVPLKKLFNTSGLSYREGGWGQKLATGKVTEAQALDALASDGKLIKRPFALTGEAALVGFDEAAYKAAFASVKA